LGEKKAKDAAAALKKIGESCPQPKPAENQNHGQEEREEKNPLSHQKKLN